MKRIRRVLIIALLSLSIFAYWSYRQHAAVVEAAEFMPVAPELHPIPAGTEIAVPGIVPLEPAADHTEQIDVCWDGRSLTMFLTDLQQRGERIRSAVRV